MDSERIKIEIVKKIKEKYWDDLEKSSQAEVLVLEMYLEQKEEIKEKPWPDQIKNEQLQRIDNQINEILNEIKSKPGEYFLKILGNKDGQ